MTGRRRMNVWQIEETTIHLKLVQYLIYRSKCAHALYLFDHFHSLSLWCAGGIKKCVYRVSLDVLPPSLLLSKIVWIYRTYIDVSSKQTLSAFTYIRIPIYIFIRYSTIELYILFLDELFSVLFFSYFFIIIISWCGGFLNAHIRDIIDNDDSGGGRYWRHWRQRDYDIDTVKHSNHRVS